MLLTHEDTFKPCSDPQSKMADGRKGEDDASFLIKRDVKVTK